MGCEKNPPYLSKSDFEEAYKAGGWREVFRRDPALSKPKTLAQRKFVAFVLRQLLWGELTIRALIRNK